MFVSVRNVLPCSVAALATSAGTDKITAIKAEFTTASRIEIVQQGLLIQLLLVYRLKTPLKSLSVLVPHEPTLEAAHPFRGW